MTMSKAAFTGLLCSFLAAGAAGQISFVSNDNYTGDWLDDNSWAPQNPSHPTSSSADAIAINGYITRQGDLTVNNANPVITVVDTLIITGNAILGSGARLNVPANGLLIVTGDLTTQGAFNLGNSGRVVVGGNVSVTNGSITNNQDFYVFGSTSTSGGGGIDGCFPWVACDPAANLGDENDLRTNDPSLRTFLETLNVLPVELIFFEASTEKETIALKWATASELNNDYFEIQRSGNGIDFEKIGMVEGNGTIHRTIHYSFEDRSPLNGVNYYRLKQHDFDGAFEYSHIVRDFFDIRQAELKVYPNPARENLQISLDDRFINTTVQLKLYDSKGMVAMEREFVPSSSMSMIGLENVKVPGIYVLHVRNGRFEEFGQVAVAR